jgi:photosystem II stability/assembly factor-like uncharacterized protein
MRAFTFFYEQYKRKSHISFFLIIVSLILLPGCKKDDTPSNPGTTIPPPLSMQVISGNNQVGYPVRALTDTIIIKVTPKNVTDIDSYSYFFKSAVTGSQARANTEVSNGEYLIKVIWTLGASTNPQQMTVLLYGNCNNLFTGNCKPLDSVILKATVNGKQWTKVYADNSGIIGPGAFWDIHFSDQSHGVAVGDFKTGQAVTNDGGNSWSFVPSIRDDYFELSFSNKDTGLVIVTNNYAYFTVDGGNSFTAGVWSPPTVGHRSSTDYFMVNRNLIYSVGNQGAIARSINGGQSWTKYTGFTFINGINSITCPDANTCYACGQIAKIIKTSDGGNSWTEQTVLMNNNLRKIYFFDKDFGFAGGQLGALVRTTDGGAHWSTIQTGLRFDIIDIRFFSNTNGYIVSNAGEVAKTYDGGLTWKKAVADNYGVYDLTRAFIKDSTAIFGLQWQNIFKYDPR